MQAEARDFKEAFEYLADEYAKLKASRPVLEQQDTRIGELETQVRGLQAALEAATLENVRLQGAVDDFVATLAAEHEREQGQLTTVLAHVAALQLENGVLRAIVTPGEVRSDPAELAAAMQSLREAKAARKLVAAAAAARVSNSALLAAGPYTPTLDGPTGASGASAASAGVPSGTGVLAAGPFTEPETATPQPSAAAVAGIATEGMPLADQDGIG
jgi:hypothetical protein